MKGSGSLFTHEETRDLWRVNDLPKVTQYVEDPDVIEHLNGLAVCVWECSGYKSFRESLRRGHMLSVFGYVSVP